MYLIVEVSILPPSTILMLDFSIIPTALVFSVFHFINHNMVFFV
jgi:hypothetical protein